jgi:hypothetical protein
LAAELLFEGGTPGYKLETEAIVDHCEAAGAQDDPLPVNSRDGLTFRRWAMDKPSFHGNLTRGVVQFPLSQGVDQIAREGNSLPLPADEPFTSKMLGAPIHRIPHLGPKPASHHHRLAREKLAVQPRGARRGHLLL